MGFSCIIEIHLVDLVEIVKDFFSCTHYLAPSVPLWDRASRKSPDHGSGDHGSKLKFQWMNLYLVLGKMTPYQYGTTPATYA